MSALIGLEKWARLLTTLLTWSPESCFRVGLGPRPRVRGRNPRALSPFHFFPTLRLEADRQICVRSPAVAADLLTWGCQLTNSRKIPLILEVRLQTV